MPEPNTFASKTESQVRPQAPKGRQPYPPKQQRMMVTALTLLLIALGFVLYQDRDFWFPDTQQAEDQSQPATPGATATSAASIPHTRTVHKAPRKHEAQPKEAAPSAPPPGATITARTVLPPLEVEVVAGSTHRTVRPGSNSVRVEMQPDSAPAEATAAPEASKEDTAASVTSNAAERVQMSTEQADIVTHSVKPGYPMLARQMKVQGSVVLQALIGRDGLIEELRVLSGPPILANAAEEAVKQWHFKPHFQGSEAVETQTRITVNFTISTN
jgi:periplasmic protein TonB